MKGQRSLRDNEKGVALVTVILMTTLAVGLVLLALNNGRVGQVVTTTYVADKKNAECGRGNLDVAEGSLVNILDNHNEGLAALQSDQDMSVQGTILDEIGNIELATTSPSKAEFEKKLRGIEDQDITIQLVKGVADCTTVADIEFLYIRRRPQGGDEEGSNVAYIDSIGGRRCPNGSVYSVTTQASQPDTGVTTQFRSVYYDCPS